MIATHKESGLDVKAEELLADFETVRSAYQIGHGRESVTKT
jgi:hypothetical protein